MTIKFTNGESHEITEAHKIRCEILPNHGIDVCVYGATGERTGRYLVRDEGGQFTRGYVMDAGKTIEVIKQVAL